MSEMQDPFYLENNCEQLIYKRYIVMGLTLSEEDMKEKYRKIRQYIFNSAYLFLGLEYNFIGCKICTLGLDENITLGFLQDFSLRILEANNIFKELIETFELKDCKINLYRVKTIMEKW